MEEWDSYLYSAIFLLLLFTIYYVIKLRRRIKPTNNRQRYIFESLELAQKQFEEFLIKLPDVDGKSANYSGLLESFSEKMLVLDVNGYIPNEVQGKQIEVFFTAKREEGPVFYAFSSPVEKVSADYENSRLTLKTPDHLRVEKKRHFTRVQPAKEDIRVVGVWPIEAGKKLPSSTNEIGAPLTHYKPGVEGNTVQIANISGSGLALTFSAENLEEIKKNFGTSNQILCLVVFVLEENDKPVAFWCTGEIMNGRITEGEKPELVLGLEFTNWAVLEASSNEIHWAHSSPLKGAKPILQWVEKIEKRKSNYSK